MKILVIIILILLIALLIAYVTIVLMSGTHISLGQIFALLSLIIMTINMIVNINN